jgi:hypothetical protein
MVNPPNLRARAARRRTFLLAMGAAAALVATLPFHASAQRGSSKTRGLFVGAHLEGASLKVEDSDRSNGGGGGVVAGWVFGNGIGVFTQFDRSNVDVRNQPDTEGTWSITQFDAGLRYYFKRPQSTVVPYLQGSGTYRDVKVEELPGSPGSVIDVSGTGFTAGAGVDLHITPSVAFEFALLFTSGSLKDAELDGAPIDGFESVSAQSSRFNLGLTWWPTD